MISALQIKGLRLLVHTLGRLSDGIRIACDNGLTAGKTLDYVYRNQPSGRLVIGKFIDRIYLSNKAWQAIRDRRGLIVETLRGILRRQLEEHGEAFLLDIASGQGGYVLDVLAERAREPVKAICWDLNKQWLHEGRHAARRRGVQNIAYEWADAMDAKSYRRLPSRPDIVIASGFYDWFESDDSIRKSLALVHDALGDQGWFVFTALTGHLSLQTTNAIFDSFDGGPLRMKDRPARAVHDWARQAGFQIETSATDPMNCHTVSVVRKLKAVDKHPGQI